MTPQEAYQLKELAKTGITARAQVADLKRELASAKREASIWRERYEKLKAQTQDFLAALKRAPERVKAFIQDVLHREAEQPKKEHTSPRNGLER